MTRLTQRRDAYRKLAERTEVARLAFLAELQRQSAGKRKDEDLAGELGCSRGNVQRLLAPWRAALRKGNE